MREGKAVVGWVLFVSTSKATVSANSLSLRLSSHPSFLNSRFLNLGEVTTVPAQGEIDLIVCHVRIQVNISRILWKSPDTVTAGVVRIAFSGIIPRLPIRKGWGRYSIDNNLCTLPYGRGSSYYLCLENHGF